VPTGNANKLVVHGMLYRVLETLGVSCFSDFIGFFGLYVALAYLFF
jgi:hypothetical protein